MNTQKLFNLIKTPYKYNKLVVAASGQAGKFDRLYADAPFLFRHNGKFCMTYIGFDGSGYQTALAVSDDLINWQRQGLLLGRGSPGSINEFNMAMTSLLKDDELFGTGELKKINGRYVGTYHAYPRPGYEEGPAIIGLCFSEDLKNWELSQPILRAEDGAAWERGGLYKSYLIENRGTYYLFYNAKNRIQWPWAEQTGVAISSDLINWQRHPGNPILSVSEKGAFDDIFASDPCVHKHGNNWIMFYFGNSSDGHAREGAAFSSDLLHWEKSGEILIDIGAPGTVDSLHAHKPGIIGANGVLYHFYCAAAFNPGFAGDQTGVEGEQARGISLAVSDKRVLPDAETIISTVKC